MHALLLALGLLGHSGWVLGQEASCLVVLTLVLISSRLGALTVLLLLRKPLLVLVLMLTLVLMTLLELLG
jgi:hypothetical protein